MADPAPYDEAYPTLAEPVATFIARYLASRETVLIHVKSGHASLCFYRIFKFDMFNTFRTKSDMMLSVFGHGAIYEPDATR